MLATEQKMSSTEMKITFSLLVLICGHCSGSSHLSNTTNTTASPSTSPPPCPPSCDCSEGPASVVCSGDPDIQQLSFVEYGLTEVPIFDGLYPSLTEIYLSRNFIQVVRTRAFSPGWTPRLSYIGLDGNEITSLHEDAFVGSLETIDLCGNQIQTFRSRAFRMVDNTFETLILKSNLIDSFDFNSPFDRDRFPALQVLINDNPILCDPTLPAESAPFYPLCNEFILPSGDMESTCYNPQTLEIILLADFCQSQTPQPMCPMSCDCEGGPSNVVCYGDASVDELKLNGLSLTEVPQFLGFYPLVNDIDLSDNMIERIRTRAFSPSMVPSLEEIKLNNNRIFTLESEAFEGRLEIINLDNNQLRSFRTGAFRRVETSLATIVLSNNLIEDFEFNPPIDSSTFPNLRIFLHNNPIPCDPQAMEAPFQPLCSDFIIPSGSSEATCNAVSTTSGDTETITLLDFCYLIAPSSPQPTMGSGPPNDSGALELPAVIGLSVSIPVLVIIIVLVIVFVFIGWRVKAWERRFNDVTVAQAENNLRWKSNLNPQAPPSPRYATSNGFNPKTPPPPYSSSLVPGGPTVFFGNDSCQEDVYASIDTRPLPTVPKDGASEEVEYEDGYILRVESVPPQNELPGIKIAKRRRLEAERLSKHKPLQSSSEPIPTESDSEQESETQKPISSHQLDTEDPSIDGESASTEPSAPPQDYLEPNVVVVTSQQESSEENKQAVAAPTEAWVKEEHMHMGSDETSGDQELYLPVVQ